MARHLKTLDEPDLEAALLRKSVGDLEAGRAVCEDCGRTPLIGERMYRFGPASAVCALCTPLRAGEPDAAELVRHSEAGITVRRLSPRAA
jgi:hypothetical protein